MEEVGVETEIRSLIEGALLIGIAAEDMSTGGEERVEEANFALENGMGVGVSGARIEVLDQEHNQLGE